MAQPPEKYEPGELERTRKNLGGLSNEEAQQMAQKLGGEVGIERTPDKVDEEYEKLRLKALEQSSAWDTRRRASRFVPASPAYQIGRKINPRENLLPRMRWRDRVKTDFLLARPQFKAKTFGQAMRSLTAFFRLVPDTVNRQFILEGDRLFAKGVENLVLAVRGLSSKNYKNAHQNLRRIPLYNHIIHILRDWDIDAVNKELTQLQREPRERSFADFDPLLRVLLKPLFKLSRLNPHVHLLPAVTKMYELARMYQVSRDERERLNRFYIVAREELPLVFTQLRVRMYPVLLKILSDRFLDPDHFYLEKAEAILEYLELKESDLLQDSAEHDRIHSPLPEAETTPSASSVEIPAAPTLLSKQGFELLEQLFPRAGWSSLEEDPDLFSYYQTVFDFPKGTDLVPVDDPIQVVLSLSAVLQQLFFGFQNIRWGTIKNQFGEIVQLQEQIDKNIARWHFFIEEFFSKNYLPQLQDYCREVERAGPLSAESKRKEHQLLWLKRNYLLPHLMIPVLEDVKVKSLGYPNLSIQVKEMLALLAPVVVEIEKRPKQLTSLLNPDSKVQFPVENPVSQRFQAVLRSLLRSESGEVRILELSTNRALLFYALSVLSSLDFLLATPNNALYKKEQKFLYRTSGLPNDDKPVYNVPKKNTLLLLKKLNDLQPPEEAEMGWQDKLGELYGPFIVQEELRKCAAAFHSDKFPFTVIQFTVLDEALRDAFFLLISKVKEPGQTISPHENASFLWVLPGVLADEAEDLARSVLVQGVHNVPKIPLLGLVVPFQKNWTVDKLNFQWDRGRVMSKDVPPQILGVYKATLQSFEFRDDLPVP